MHAWVTGLSTKSPSNDIGMYLFQKTNSISKLELALEYSDIILFDFLLDGMYSNKSIFDFLKFFL